jgi:glutathione S-transferase
MEAVTIVTILALMQFFWFGIEVGMMRAKHQCKAPAITGAPEFERMFRVQQNTMEQIVMFIPALWLFAEFVNPLWAAGMGVVYLIGRTVYRAAYVKDPNGRSTGFMMTALPTAVMLAWVLVDAVLRLIK